MEFVNDTLMDELEKVGAVIMVKSNIDLEEDNGF